MGTPDGSLRMLTETEALRVLADYAIPYPPHALARTADEAARLADALGYPVVAKVVSQQVKHKTDVGGVILGLENAAHVRSAFRAIRENVAEAAPEAQIEGVLVVKQVSGGREVIVGALQDRTYGPVVMFGLGGVFTEILQDVTFRVAPLRHEEAVDMIRETQGFPVLNGARGGDVCDLDAAADLVAKVSRLISDRDDIAELDLNPVCLLPEGLVALDVRILLA